MTARRTPAAALVIVLSLGAGGSAAAVQGDALDYNAHFQNGVKLYDEGNVSAARAEFRRAYELSRNYKILFNLAVASSELRDYAEALRLFEQYLLDGGTRLDAAKRETVEGELKELRRRVGRISVDCNVAGAQIRVDDRPIGTAPIINYVVSVGEHRVTLAKPGWETASKTVVLAMGDTVPVAFALKQLELRAAPAQTTTRPVPETSSERPPSVWPYFGFAAAAATVGLVFGGMALAEKSVLDSRCFTPKVCPLTDESTYKAATRDATVSLVGFGAAVVGAAIGTFIRFRGSF